MKLEQTMKIKQLISKIKTSNQYALLKEIFTLGGNSKYAPAALTFYIILSLIPVITIIFLILSLLGYKIDDLLEYLKNYLELNEGTILLLNNYFSNIPSTSRTIFKIGFLILVYISSKGLYFFSFVYAKIYKTETKYTKFFKQKLWGVLSSLLLDGFLAVLIIFLTFFDNIFTFKNSDFKGAIIFFLISFILFIFLLFLYSISSKEKVKFKDIYFGALLSALGITIGMNMYIFYLNNYSNAKNYYGPLTSYILLLLVIYYSSFITLLGVEINFLKQKKNLHAKIL